MSQISVSVALLAHAGHAAELGRSNRSLALVAVLGLTGLAVVVGRTLVARHRDTVVATVALCSAGAGAVHAVVTPEHFQEHVAFGVFFLVVTVWQMGVVVAALHRPSRALWASTALGTVAVLLIWGLSRTTGLPVGPEPWTTEPTGFLDLACGAYEVGIVAGCLWLLQAAAVPAAKRGTAAWA